MIATKTKSSTNASITQPPKIPVLNTLKTRIFGVYLIYLMQIYQPKKTTKYCRVEKLLGLLLTHLYVHNFCHFGSDTQPKINTL